MVHEKESQPWLPYKLGDLADLVNGRGFKSTEWSAEGLPIIRISNLNGDRDFNCYNGDFDEKHRVVQGDLLFSWSGNRGTSFGPVIWRGIEGLLNQHIFKIIIKKKVDQQYLFYELKRLTQKIENSAHGGSGLVHVKKSDLEQLQILLPPVYEQQKVTEILSSVDEALEKTEAIIKQTETLKKGLMQQLLTKGIGHTEFKQTEIGESPVSWDLCRLGEISSITMGQSPKGDSYNNERLGSPLLNGPTEFGEIYPTPVQWTNSPTKICKAEDILVCVRGSSTGRMNISNDAYCIGRGLAAITADEAKCTQTFIKYHVKRLSTEILNRATGSTFPNIDKARLSNLLVPLPGIKEQEEITKVLDKVEEKQQLEKQKYQVLQNLKKSLMQTLLTGKVRVNVNHSEVLL
ncbi:restriction endonuclease subunit S [Paenibacillus sp. M2]|uniref:restriction endonuclease subunit S n=1 Tax=Paenibacillus sp. M2 TaxID=3341793 RepID=UPI0039892A5A